MVLSIKGVTSEGRRAGVWQNLENFEKTYDNKIFMSERRANKEKCDVYTSERKIGMRAFPPLAKIFRLWRASVKGGH